MSLETKRIKELFGYARTLTKEQGVGVMAGRAVGFFKRRFFGKKARYLPSKQTLEAQRADAAANAASWPTISILTPLYNTPPQFLHQFLDSVQAQTAPNWQLVLVAVGDGANDVPMLNLAGLGIAFHAKPKVKATARQSISTIGLDGILYFLGLKDSRIEA